MLKIFLSAVADLFEAWSDGSNDPGDIKKVSDAVADVVSNRFDDELDELLSKPFVGSALSFLAGVIRSLFVSPLP
ncbi:MAG: hypothetical protein ACYSW3_30295 [Planctomycetota bacterium]|jgi:hypothetical protein